MRRRTPAGISLSRLRAELMPLRLASCLHYLTFAKSLPRLASPHLTWPNPVFSSLESGSSGKPSSSCCEAAKPYPIFFNVVSDHGTPWQRRFQGCRDESSPPFAYSAGYGEAPSPRVSGLPFRISNAKGIASAKCSARSFRHSDCAQSHVRKAQADSAAARRLSLAFIAIVSLPYPTPKLRTAEQDDTGFTP